MSNDETLNPKILCHAEGDQCLGCDHYHGRAPVCAFADNTRPPAQEAVAEATCRECGTKVPMPLETTRTWMMRAGYLAPEWVDEVAKEIARQWVTVGQNHAEPFVRNLITGELEKARFTTPPSDEARRLYNELLFAVETKHPDESRHATALRYIRQAEHKDNMPAQTDKPEGE